MILAELKRLADAEKLIPIPHYEPVRVSYVIVLDQSGRYLNTERLKSVPAGRKKARGKFLWIPCRSERTSGVEAEFLVDNAKYVLGEGGAKSKRNQRCQRLFVLKAGRAANATKDSGFRAVRQFLHDVLTGKQAVPLPTDWESNDLFGFRLDTEPELLISDHPTVRAYWAGQRERATTGSKQTCPVCSRTVPHCTKHPGLRIWGGNPAGAKLVSYNAGAFLSYGLDGNENAAVCLACADAYTTALTRLLDGEYPHYPDGIPLSSPRNYQLSKDTVAVFWARESAKFADIFAELLDGNPDAIHALLGSPWQGRPVALDNPDAFFVLILSGAQGRVIVRDWIEATVHDVARNLKQYFDDLALVKMWDKEPDTLPLRWLLDGLVPPGKTNTLPPALAGGLFEAALFGRRYPLALLDAALRRLRAGDECNRARASIIKAVLKRNYQQEAKTSMDTDCKIVSYRLGRLFAVLEKLRQAARGDSNSSQFFAAASTTPVIVFARLLKDAQHHATKAGKLGSYYQKLIEEILEPLDPQHAFPSTLELSDQGMFALGYYHQRAERKKSE